MHATVGRSLTLTPAARRAWMARAFDGRRAWGTVTPRRLLATTATPVPLPALQEIDINGEYRIKYIDLKPTTTSGDVTDEQPTIVFIHGSPGTYQDFKYLIPLLRDKARVVGINLPGNGDSAVLDTANYYERLRAINIGRAAYEAVAALCAEDENVFVVGHSFGGHATVNVAGFNATDHKINIRGLALLASAGLRPHKALQMGNIGLLWRLLKSPYSVIEATGRGMTRHLFTRIWRFPTRESTEYYVAGLVRCASADFALFNEHVDRIREVPAFFAWARDDAFMEEEVFLELSSRCQRGPRFAFKSGGHNIQKTKAPFLAEQILQWTRGVIREAAPSQTHSRDVINLP